MLNNTQSLLGYSYIVYPLIAWAVIWKGIALWRAARLKHLGWYIALLLINTIGIFEIIYIIATGKKYKESNGCAS